jgi:hypothetical protein
MCGDSGNALGGLLLLSLSPQPCMPAEMPGMSQCATYTSMCTSGGGSSSYLCSSSGPTSTPGFTPGPVMRMFLNQDTPYFLLFPTWTPSTPRECAGAWFAIFALALVAEVFQVGAEFMARPAGMHLAMLSGCVWQCYGYCGYMSGQLTSFVCRLFGWCMYARPFKDCFVMDGGFTVVCTWSDG